MKTDHKTLYLVRHAKAMKGPSFTSDIDRPLHETGYEEAYRMAAGMAQARELPRLIISSPAVRAISTALIFQRSLRVADNHLLVREKLYEASLDDLIEFVAGLDDRFDSIMLVGHNPSFTQLASKMDSTVVHVPTAGVVRFDFEVEKWRHSSYINAELRMFIYP